MADGLLELAQRARAVAAPSANLEYTARILLADFAANVHAGTAQVPAADWRDDGTAGQAAVLALRAHAGDQDDLDWATMTHPGSVVWPVVAALLYEHKVQSVAELILDAAAAGYEITGAVASLLGPSAGRLWHLSAIAGQAGAAAAAAVLLGLDDSQRASAIGLAVTCAGGLGLTMARRASATGWHRANAAVGGLQAARAAHAGARVPADLIEAHGGAADAFGAAGHVSSTPERVLERTSLRLYPTNGLTQSAVHAAAELRRRRRDAPAGALVLVSSAVASATCRGAPGAPWWDLPRAVSVALFTGDPWLVSCAQAEADARNAGLIDRIEVHAADLPPYGAVVRADGDEVSVPLPPGYRPVEDLELARHKWATLAAPDVEHRAGSVLSGDARAVLSLLD